MWTDKLTTSLAGTSDIKQIIRLNLQEYGAKDILATEDDFAWRCRQNPMGKASIPVIRNNAGDAVGFIFLVPLQMRINQKNFAAATGTNLVIHPHYRRSLGYIKLIRYFFHLMNTQGISLHYSFVSEERYQQIRKGSKDKTPSGESVEKAWIIPLVFKPLSFKAIIQGYPKLKKERVFSGLAGNLLSLLFHRRSSPIPDESQDKTIPVKQFDKKFDKFWDDILDKYPAMVSRSGEFLRWRFSNLSGREYHIFTACADDKLTGYLVVRCTTVRNIKTGLIMDFLVAGNRAGKKAGVNLLAQAEVYCRSKKMSLLMGLMPDFTDEYRLFRKAGYRRLPPAISPRPFRFASFIHDNKNEVLTSLSEKDWFITLADYESF
jgi:hypothetical protein